MRKPITPDVYIVHSEVEVLPTSELYEGEKRMFCFVACFCVADDKQDAIGRAKIAFSEDDMNLIKVDRIDLYEEDAWEQEDQQEMDKGANEALETGDVVYSGFSCYYE